MLQPYPIARADRIKWLQAEIRREHSDFLSLVPSLANPPGAKFPAAWESLTHKSMQLWALAAELSGLES